jgi:hypothetical protein
MATEYGLTKGKRHEREEERPSKWCGVWQETAGAKARELVPSAAKMVGYRCTREVGHSGRHECHIGGEVVCHWTNLTVRRVGKT